MTTERDGLRQAEAEIERLKLENEGLHRAIETFWTQQCGEHACGCDEFPECTHSLNAYVLRKEAMKYDIDVTTSTPEAKHPDSARIDWLSNHSESYGVALNAAFYSARKQYLFDVHTGTDTRHKGSTLREAIDAAMQSGREEAK